MHLEQGVGLIDLLACQLTDKCWMFESEGLRGALVAKQNMAFLLLSVRFDSFSESSTRNIDGQWSRQLKSYQWHNIISPKSCFKQILLLFLKSIRNCTKHPQKYPYKQGTCLFQAEWKCHSIYWPGEAFDIMRGTWFYQASWQPLPCEQADRIEQEHLLRFRSHKMADYVWDAATGTRLESKVSGLAQLVGVNLHKKSYRVTSPNQRNLANCH